MATATRRIVTVTVNEPDRPAWEGSTRGPAQGFNNRITSSCSSGAEATVEVAPA